MTAQPPHFADRLTAAVRRHGNPVLVGLDPRYEQLPEGLKTSGDAADWSGHAALT